MRKMALFALVAVLSAACEGGSSSTTGPSSSPYNQTQTGNVEVYGITRHALAIPRSGSMTVRLAWQDAAVDLDLHLAPSSCVELYPLVTCGVLVTSAATTGTSEQVARSVNSGDNFMLFVDNLSTTQTQNYTLTINIQ
jgi:hypothetical protein